MQNTSIRNIIILILTLSLSLIAKGQIEIEYEVYDNVFLWGCSFEGNQRGIFVNILGVSGGVGIYTVSHDPSIKCSKATLNENDNLEIFVPLNTNMNNIDFTIADSQGDSVNIDDNVKSLLYFAANIAAECQAPNKCVQDHIVHNNGDRIYTDFYQVKKTITSSAEVSDRNTSYIAGESITLLSGFSTINLTNFAAEIEQSCP